MLTEIYKGYSRNGLIFSAPSGDAMVHLAEPDVFQPNTDQSMQVRYLQNSSVNKCS